MATQEMTALITGASNGIGYEISKIFASHGHPVVLVARNAEKLNALADEIRRTYKVKALVIPMDLSRPQAPEELFKALESQQVPIDILVNNAGYGIYTPFTEVEAKDTLNMLQLNILALTHLTHLFLPGMIKRGQGRILNVGSIGSFIPTPSMAVYCATKAYVLSFSEALHVELEGTGVTVTALCPGNTDTGFHARAGVEKGSDTMSARLVAEEGYRALMHKRPVTVPGLYNQFLVSLPRLLPRGWVPQIAGRALKSAE